MSAGEQANRLHVVIMGVGRTGTRLAENLVRAGQQVTVIDWNAASFARLPEDFEGRTVLGNAMDQDVLRLAGIESADVFVAAASGDNRNIMACQIVQQVFAVPKVISRIKDPIRAEIYSKRGIEVNCRTTEGADVILDLVASGDTS